MRGAQWLAACRPEIAERPLEKRVNSVQWGFAEMADVALHKSLMKTEQSSSNRDGRQVAVSVLSEAWKSGQSETERCSTAPYTSSHIDSFGLVQLGPVLWTTNLRVVPRKAVDIDLIGHSPIYLSK